jgi:Family of unknown function (DUF5694)
MRRVIVGLLSLGLSASLAGAAHAQGAQPEKARVMILGTYHFHNPGADRAQFTVADPLSEPKQREIAEVVGQLERFRPTKIAIEWPPSRADSTNAQYARYRAGQFTLGSNEVHQLGFRLASRLGHERLYLVDYSKGLPIDSMMKYAGVRDPEGAARFNAVIAEVEGMMSRMQREMTVGQILRYMNEPAMLDRALQVYVDMTTIGAGDGYIGARVAADWYDRNIHMFANLARATRPGDRVLLIVGQGHAPIIRHLVQNHPAMELVEPLEFLR